MVKRQDELESGDRKAKAWVYQIDSLYSVEKKVKTAKSSEKTCVKTILILTRRKSEPSSILRLLGRLMTWVSSWCWKS